MIWGQSLSVSAAAEFQIGHKIIEDFDHDGFFFDLSTIVFFLALACRSSGLSSLGLAPPDFDGSVNPISTKGGRLYPPNNTGTPEFSDLPTALKLEEKVVGHDSNHELLVPIGLGPDQARPELFAAVG